MAVSTPTQRQKGDSCFRIQCAVSPVPRINSRIGGEPPVMLHARAISGDRAGYSTVQIHWSPRVVRTKNPTPTAMIPCLLQRA